MTKEFEPYQKHNKCGNGFTNWEYKSVKNNQNHVEISAEEVFQAECERLRQEAVEKGHAQGLQMAQKEIDEKKKQFADWIDLLQNPVKLLDDQLIQELIQTIIWLSQHCIGVALSVHPERLRDLLNVLKTELPSLHAHKQFVMNHQDMEWIKSELGEKEIPGLHDILTSDPLLNRGDFYLKSEHSELDGRLHSRLAALFAKYITQDTLLAPVSVKD